MSLPTLEKLGSTVDPDVDARVVAKEWFNSFKDVMIARDVSRILSLFVDDAFWRDMLSLTWDFHTYEGKVAINQFLSDQLPKFQPIALQLREDLTALEMPYRDIAWIQAFFAFDTVVGHASGIFRLVPLSDGSWKAHVVYTNLEDLKGFPEKIGFLRDHKPNHGKWHEIRKREQEFLDDDPSVVIVGGGHSGLDVAARLKVLGVKALVVEKNKRIGDNWRNRYDGLCLHDAIWRDHLPYLPFPPSWPVYMPALKLADWFEFYSHALELNVWTSAKVVSINPGTEDRRWSVKVIRDDGTERIFNVNHVVLATGFGGGLPRWPNIPGQDEFKGQTLHSNQHKHATDHLGKKVVVIGAGASGHDLCSDYVDHGIEATMVQRGPTYVISSKECLRMLTERYREDGPSTDLADRISASFPNTLAVPLRQRTTRTIAEADKDFLDALRRVGFKTWLGPDDSGLLGTLATRIGTFYIDVGASRKIIDGRIKLKSDSRITKFIPNGLLFEDGTILDADVVVFATGFADTRESYLPLLPSYLHDAIQPVCGLDKEGEVNAWREMGGRATNAKKLAGLWVMLGNLAMCRFHSKHVALQIKAYEEGIFGERY